MKYKEIFKLKEMLEDAGIPFDFKEHFGLPEEIVKAFPDICEHYQILYPSESDRYISVIEGFGTYGAERDLLEIMGGLTHVEKQEMTDEDDVIGGLTAKNVFNRIKNHYKKGGIKMKITRKVVNEETWEIEEVTEEVTEEVKDETLKEKISNILGCDATEFYNKYMGYVEAEAEFKKIYEPFKEKLLKLYSEVSDMPNSILIYGLELIYVSPSSRSYIDNKKLKEELPEIAEKFTKVRAVEPTIRLRKVSVDSER